ncbi:RNA-directed DNA polymerase, eukaryota [Tanacetum coccineum]
MYVIKLCALIPNVLMIVVVYAPQEAKEKRMLWDYLAHVSNQWVGKLVMMGDFNEVRYKSDIYGTNFNAHDAEIFNSFIYKAGLDEVPLGGSAYTCWTSIVHKVRVLQGRGINVVDYIRLSREWGEHAVLADNWYEGVSSNSVLHITHFEKKSEKVNFEEMQLNSLAEISSMTTLVPCENRYVWTLESTGLFSASIRIGEIEWNRFRKLVCADWWVKSVPIKIMRKISSWWNIDYSDVNSYEEWQVWLVSIRIQSKLKGVLQGVYYGVNSDVKRRSSGTIGLRTLILFLFDLAPC